MKSTSKCPSFSLITTASDGDIASINKVLQHYDAYISKASLRPLYDDYGNVYIAVDTELKGRIRSAIMEMIMKFKVEIV